MAKFNRRIAGKEVSREVLLETAGRHTWTRSRSIGAAVTQHPDPYQSVLDAPAQVAGEVPS